MNDCPFCWIAAGHLSAHHVLQDEHTLAFLDIRPATPGHTLVIPRTHARDLWDITQERHGQVAAMVHRVAALLKAALAPEGLNVRHNTGRAAGQDVPHYHVHVVPRRTGDGLRPGWTPPPAPPQELEQVLARITQAR
ncbi:Histidine triad (HIT) nucleotide-binding protein, similarity with At5g48545 and yeast YDL125C (HNT1) [[Actinomadura] parvosata subsp. kistnae]|uniref:HIT domain-containing protein n=1 Tax=[Actinomadura] parvosata subsp. kistnae TaxID=1909395 RepID=A0A1U9ZXM6_9ACTN|nr:HIT domain-containing protein [Nonomuraea sp. ATCC 55076]AQZ62702.1 hypothetical protein BKM31_15640 [Nonomuraea sp. ATCC 55076]SPL89011.1 Histidine triad (HIT) nucleotide-binding protein, similarity with At5g48545 and yeast YDL125C (HNT1) [Actinomadura parvosata subsp. kistnae]